MSIEEYFNNIDNLNDDEFLAYMVRMGATLEKSNVLPSSENQEWPGNSIEGYSSYYDD